MSNCDFPSEIRYRIWVYEGVSAQSQMHTKRSTHDISDVLVPLKFASGELPHLFPSTLVRDIWFDE